MTTPGPRHALPFCIGPWIAADEDVFSTWIEQLAAEAELIESSALHPVIIAFKNMVTADPALFSLSHQMFEQVPLKSPYHGDIRGEPQARSFEHMLKMLHLIIHRPPEFTPSGSIGLPINAILDWSMGTTCGHAFYLNERVNQGLKTILKQWSTFLASPESRTTLNTDPDTGWLGHSAHQKMPGFIEDFECNPGQPHFGFMSWDDFFTRRLRAGRRPVQAAGDGNVIVNACESAPYRIAYGVETTDRFWIKSQPYSLLHMLANDELAPRFQGATVYQAFLDQFSYHRWHSPVDGTVVKAYVQEGTYFSETISDGQSPADPEQSQAYITQVATRALIFIQADNPAIGLICFMAVGMADVSSCEITIKPGQRLVKGEQTGLFHFGGSTYCLIMRPEVKLAFDLHGQQPGLHAHNILLNQAIATVVS